MKKILSLFLCFFLFGCSEPNSNNLTVKELASATGVLWWNMEIPNDHNAEKTIGLMFVDKDGLSSNTGGSSGWKPGETVKVFIADLDQEKLKYSIIGKSSTSRGECVNRLYNLGSGRCNKDIGSKVKLGDVLIKKSSTSNIGLPLNEMQENELGITFACLEPS